MKPCLYTKDKKKKLKSWIDGYYKYMNGKINVYDLDKKLVCSKVTSLDNEIETFNYLIYIENNNISKELNNNISKELNNNIENNISKELNNNIENSKTINDENSKTINDENNKIINDENSKIINDENSKIINDEKYKIKRSNEEIFKIFSKKE